MKDATTASYSSISYSFKISVVILLFFLILVRLAMLFYFPTSEIISDKILLSVVLCIISYLWIQELRDYFKLLLINKDLKEVHEHLQEAEINAISSLAKTEEEKDQYTHGHSERVTEISLAIAEEMNLDDKMKKAISRAGILHDIGKIGISDAIINKTEKLTDGEWEIIKSHPGKAVKILEPLKFLSVESRIILNHHERYDGKGYPNGLKGEEIGQASLILAVADSFDAMNSNRAYRERLTKEAILSELNRSRGQQLSAEVVDIFLKLLEKKPALWGR